MSEQRDERMMKEHECNLAAAAASRTQIGALPAEDARKLVLLIQRYRTEAVPSRGGGIGSLRGSVRYGFNNSAGRTDTVWAACAAAGSGQTNYNFRQMRHPVLGSIQNQAVCRWLSRWVRRRRRDDYCDSFAVRK